MYIKIGNSQYPCQCRPGATMTYRGLPEDFPATVEGTITLYTDEGFELRTDDPADYLRQTFEGGALTLTNEPVPEPAPEPPEPGVVITMEDVVETILDHEVRLTAQEMGVK